MGARAVKLAELLRKKKVVALTGAGLSTESGIPDYRGSGTARRARTPIQFREFMDSERGRQRYWARSMIGWPKLSSAQPNAGHRAIAAMERAGLVQGVITQNVDRLHSKAGAKNVVELHGALAEVICLQCGAIEAREDVQVRMRADNDTPDEALIPGPDGDAEVSSEWVERFVVPECRTCGGLLKPHVVFFGENVPRARVEQAYAWVDDADVLLVLGSSLAVFSGYRFVLRAVEQKKPIAVVNLDVCRGEEHATVVVREPLGQTLTGLCAEFSISAA